MARDQTISDRSAAVALARLRPQFLADWPGRARMGTLESEQSRRVATDAEIDVVLGDVRVAGALGLSVVP